MDGRFSNNNLEDSDNTTSDNSGEFQMSGLKMSSNQNTSHKRSRRAVQKRVVTVPIGDTDGSRIKPDGAPPYDSWAWRKYGQKPIKGSPYPRGYYRCSSSKGCPARKQVERSRVDPTMLVITYACDHNHSGPPSRNHNSSPTASPTATTTSPKSEPEESAIFATESEDKSKFPDLGDDTNSLDYTWFSDVGSTQETVLIESPVYSGMSSSREADVAVIFPMREEDESLFADLGELPECSVVFERGFYRRQCSLGAG